MATRDIPSEPAMKAVQTPDMLETVVVRHDRVGYADQRVGEAFIIISSWRRGSRGSTRTNGISSSDVLRPI
jgi:hypothetical protein